MASQRKSASSRTGASSAQNRGASSRTGASSAQNRGASGQNRGASGRGTSGQGQGWGASGQNRAASSRARATSGQAAEGDQASQAGRQTRSVEPQASSSGWRIATPGSMGWLKFSTLVLSVLGLLDSAYQTYTHFSNTALLGCSAKGDGCVQVQTSPEAMVFGIFPVAVLGLAFYIFMVAVNSPWAWRSRLPAIHWARLGSVVVGIIFVLYLVYAELIEIGAICKYCTSVHIITFILFVLIVFQATSSNSLVSAAQSPVASRRKG